MSKTLEMPNLDDLVVQHMHRDIPKIHAGQTMSGALDEIRSSPPQSSKIVYFYVIDHEKKLVVFCQPAPYLSPGRMCVWMKSW